MSRNNWNCLSLLDELQRHTYLCTRTIMSRHRHVRNLNVQDELEDHALSDGGEEDMTPEQQAQMESGMEQVRAVIGDEQVSGLSDATLRDVLWEYYFDIGRTIQWAIDEQERRRAVQERKEDSSDDNTLVSSPPGLGSTQHPQPWLQQSVVLDVNRPRIPLIYLAQQQLEQREREQQEQQEQARAQEEEEEVPQWRRTLSTILEEHTFPLSGSRSSTVTDYGQVIDRQKSSETVKGIIKPPNPTPAFAMYRLSQPNIPPSGSSGSSLLMPEIPDLASKTSLLPRSEVVTEAKPKQSKLSLRASLKASSVASQSESSRSEGTAVTYSVLRPAAQSLAPPSTIAPSFPDDASSIPVSSSASSHVRRAIQVALDQEVHDNETSQKQPASKSPPSHSQSRLASSLIPQSQRLSLTSPSPTLPLSQTSNLPSRSQPASATQSASPHPQSTITPVPRQDAPQPKKDEGPVVSSSKGPQQKSKLALLAQTKMDPRKMPRLPKTTTEYLTPIANGSTVTTAITTHYQSLFSLTDPNQSSVLPKLDLVPVSEVPVNPSSSQKRSTKLAMKIKKGHGGHKHDPLPLDSEEIQVVISPMFDPKAAPDGRALPSQFASLLINDNDNEQESDKTRSPAQSKSAMSEPSTRRSRKVRQSPATLPSFTVQPNSAFDGPSPDDIVHDKRRGTSLGQPKSQVSTSSRAPTVPQKP
ncbi:hypothetical protein M378DRAFT_943231 [Amanita muscaria Koide BX008]|uniref:HBS1-like protein N-terminal domain-containing protein n=1 Tax=Amanita muscaria (strain Koide BX008) TaxID=946122 RepID=A0A0C2XFL5_AMAMK|nr:hypothetical protein M378DRAFT_943231 [Amanita muscaria Koide BX008]